MTSKIPKRLLLPNRVRRPPEDGFSWVDRRFLQDYAPFGTMSVESGGGRRECTRPYSMNQVRRCRSTGDAVEAFASAAVRDELSSIT
jgi:hypothetical protein